MQAQVKLDRSFVAVAVGDVVHLMVDLAAPPAPADGARPPLDLVAVIDRSGSMRGDPLEAVKDAVELLVRMLGTDDRLALVTFESGVEWVLPLVHHDPDEAAVTIREIEAGGSTNLSGGWLKAVEILALPRPEALRKILLLTDGQANVGLVDADSLAALAGGQADGGIGTSTIGYGPHFDEDLLAALADGGRGNAYFAAGADDAPGIFAAEFEGLTSIVAQNLSVELRLNESVSFVGVLNDYPLTMIEGGVQVALGDAYAGERRSLIAAVEVPGLDELGPTIIAELVLRYVSLGDEVQLHTTHIPIEVNVSSATEADAAGLDLEVVEQVLTLKAAAARRQARQRVDDGDVDGARALLGQTEQSLREAASASPMLMRLSDEADDLADASTALQDVGRVAMTTKDLWAKERRAMRGRPTMTTDDDRSSG